MTRFLGAYFVAIGPVTETAVDPRVKDAGSIGTRPSALLAQAIIGPRRELATAEAARRADYEAWAIRQGWRLEENTDA